MLYVPNMDLVAFIAAAGLGTRLGELTQHTPKCLMPLDTNGSETFLDYAVAQANKLGVQKIIINTHYLADQVQAWHAQRRPTGAPITLIHESPDILETGGGLKHAWHLLDNKPVFFATADIFYTFDLAPFIARATQSDRSIMTVSGHHGGVTKALICRGEQLISIKKRMETPPEQIAQGGLVELGYANLSIIKPAFYKYLAARSEPAFPLFAAVADAVQAQELVSVVTLTGEMYNAATPERLAEAQQVYQRYKASSA